MKKFLDSLFNKKTIEGIPASKRSDTRPTITTSRTSEAITAPLTEAELDEIAQQSQRIEPIQLVVGAGRHQGKSRDKNEDALFAFTALLGAGTTALPFGIFIVADGMGGHRHGEKASETAARVMGTYLVNRLFEPLFGANPQPPEESLQEIMRAGISRTHKAIMDEAPGGGTTLTAAIAIGTQMTLAHIGDSRAYAVYLDGRIQALTRDHSLVKRLEELGQITAEEAAIHPQKSMLYRALGQGEVPDPDIFTATLPRPGYLLLCSDGLWGVIEETQIFQIISQSPNSQRACQNLIEAANMAGGPDNITAILVNLTN